jgi:hypothetical protein
MSHIVFLLEERSMKVLLDGLIPRLFPNLPFLCIPHEGKQDLEQSIPRKLRAWRTPGVHFVVVHDNDSDDCLVLKQRLVDLCTAGHRDDTLVRIACQELEAWYLAEPDALASAFGNENLRRIGAKALYRDSDAIVRPSFELEKLVPEFQKVSGARRMAPHMTRERNRSRSFRTFISGLERIAGRWESQRESGEMY